MKWEVEFDPSSPPPSSPPLPVGSVAIRAPVAGTGQILTGSLGCLGNEEILADCPTSSVSPFDDFFGRFVCSIHGFDAGVICLGIYSGA